MQQMSTPPPKLPEEQPSAVTPSQSTVISVAVGAPAAILLGWILEQVFKVQLPVEVSMAIGTLVSTFAGYFAKGGKAIHTS